MATSRLCATRMSARVAEHRSGRRGTYTAPSIRASSARGVSTIHHMITAEAEGHRSSRLQSARATYDIVPTLVRVPALDRPRSSRQHSFRSSCKTVFSPLWELFIVG